MSGAIDEYTLRIARVRSTEQSAFKSETQGAQRAKAKPCSRLQNLKRSRPGGQTPYMIIYIATAAIALLLAILWLLATSPGPGRRERMEAFSKKMIAHRGLHNNKGDAPENSLLAFQKAVEAGYGIELDVRETKDGALVVCHDDYLKRVAGVKKKISEMTLADVQKVKLYKSEQTIPTFEDVFSVIGGRVPLVAEVKIESIRNAPRISGKVAALLDEYQGPVCMESFNPAVVRWFRKNRPEMLRGQLSDQFKKEHKFPDCILMFLFSCCFFNFLTKPDFIAYRFTCADLLRFRLLHGFHHACCAGWTIRSEEDLKAALRDFDVIIFDSFIPAEGCERKTNRC